MKRFLVPACMIVGFPVAAHAQSAPRSVVCGPPPNWIGVWSSYTATGNPADLKTSTTVGETIGQAVKAAGGMAANLTACNPQLQGGSASGTDTSAAVALASNSIATATMARTSAERAMTMPQPQDFLGSGQTVAQLIAASIDVGPIINTMIGQGVKTVHFPCGNYLLKTKVLLANSVSLSGDGACTVFSITNAADDMIVGKSIQYTRVHDMTLQADVNRTGGSAITYDSSFSNRIYNVLFTNGAGSHYTNIYLNSTNSTFIDRVSGRGGNQNGITITGTTKYNQDTYISNSTFDGYAGSNIDILWSSGLYMMNMDILGGRLAGVRVNPTGSQEVDGVFVTGVLSDSNSGPGFWFTGTGAITEVHIANSWGSTNGSASNIAPGLLVDNANVDNLSVQSSEFHNNYAAGIRIAAGTNILVNGNAVFMNSVSAKGAYAGIELNSGTDYVSITNNMTGLGPVHASSGAPGKSSNYQSYGILVSPNFGGRALVAMNMTHGNISGSISYPSSAGNLTVTGNVGD